MLVSIYLKDFLHIWKYITFKVYCFVESFLIDKSVLL